MLAGKVSFKVKTPKEKLLNEFIWFIHEKNSFRPSFAFQSYVDGLHAFSVPGQRNGGPPGAC